MRRTAREIGFVEFFFSKPNCHRSEILCACAPREAPKTSRVGSPTQEQQDWDIGDEMLFHGIEQYIAEFAGKCVLAQGGSATIRRV